MAKLPPHLTITVHTDGEISTDFAHFLGQHCLAAGEQLHTLLTEYGITTQRTTFTPKPELLVSPASGSMAVSHSEVLREGEDSHA
ncbi:MAG TPA: hypothetical protein VFV38_17090 [Ktedonobacteraceae bacterium]|nr:hypothetical protein [Ktedonobacteraceae bacterium]